MFFDYLLLFINNFYIFVSNLKPIKMRKLNILKAILDFVWIMSLIALPIIIIVFTSLFFKNEPIEIPIKVNGLELDLSNTQSKLLLPVGILYMGLFIYALFFFRKLLANFKKLLIFENENADYLNKIGNLIMINAVIYALVNFIIHIINDKLTIELGYGPFLYLLGLGLFFKVLAEVFKMGKHLKEENDLMI